MFAKLLGPDGMVVDCCGGTRNLTDYALNLLPAVVPITRDGEYTLVIYGARCRVRNLRTLDERHRRRNRTSAE